MLARTLGGASGRRKDMKAQELGQNEMTILCNVGEPVSLLCSMREFRGHSTYQRKWDFPGTPALLRIFMVADLCRPGLILEDAIADLASSQQNADRCLKNRGQVEALNYQKQNKLSYYKGGDKVGEDGMTHSSAMEVVNRKQHFEGQDRMSREQGCFPVYTTERNKG